jgi:hypothetical protein
LLLILAVAALVSGTAPARANFIYSEDTDGDLSGSRFSPTVLEDAGVGSNTLSGNAVTTDGVTELDYFTVVIPAGLQLDSLVLVDFSGGEAVSFLAVQAGTTFTEPPDSPDVGQLLGWAHFGPADIGLDILGTIGGGAGAIGFTPPLLSGSYTFWLQETSETTAFYDFDFVVSGEPIAVPEPGPLCLVGLGALLGLGYVRWRYNRSRIAAVPG